MNDERSNIAFAGAMRSTWRRWREGTVPRGAWHRWMLSLLAGLIISCIVCAAITILAQRNAQRLNQWDARVLREIERGPMSFQNAVLAESPGNLAYLIPLTTALAVVLLPAAQAARRGVGGGNRARRAHP